MAGLKSKRDQTAPAIASLPALDVEFLNKATFGDVALRTEIIGLFRQQLATLRDQLTIKLDRASWAYLTHTLKGSASAVGAMQLAALADRWESGTFPGSAAARATCAEELSQAEAAFSTVAEQL
jgi:HPt (histidine-containing phosphotransfer) domain-containing protein